MTKESDLQKISSLATQVAQAAALGSTAGLNLLLAEMNALSAMMPGMTAARPSGCSCEEQEARARAADAEVEASFDNMPV